MSVISSVISVSEIRVIRAFSRLACRFLIDSPVTVTLTAFLSSTRADENPFQIVILSRQVFLEIVLTETWKKSKLPWDKVFLNKCWKLSIEPEDVFSRLLLLNRSEADGSVCALNAVWWIECLYTANFMSNVRIINYIALCINGSTVTYEKWGKRTCVMVVCSDRWLDSRFELLRMIRRA